MPRFYLETGAAVGEDVCLSENETLHAARVFRVKTGDAIDLFNGKGERFLAIAGRIQDGKLIARITGRAAAPFASGTQVAIGAAVFRPERMETLIQKSCELGAHAVFPILTERSIVKLSADRWRQKIQRWHKIIRESCKQCGLDCTPEITEPKKFKDFIGEIATYDLALIPTLGPGTVPLAETLAKAGPCARVLVLIGPEGDFSATEVDAAVRAGAQPVSLGPFVLRSETAGIYVLSVLQFYYREIAHEK